MIITKPKTMTHPRYIRVCTLLAMAGIAPSSAAPYAGSAYEGFDYTTADMTNTLAGGTGWNATGSSGSANTTTWGVTLAPNGTAVGNQFNLGATVANQTITAVSLDFTGSGYPAEIGQKMLITGLGQVGRNLGQNVDSGTLYYSYLVKKTVDQVRTVNFALFGDNGAAVAPQERVTIGQLANNVTLKLPDGTPDPDAATKANLGQFAALISSPLADGTLVAANAGVYTSSAPIPFALGNTYLVVAKIEFNVSGVNDRLTVYINPTSLTDESSLTPYLQVNGFNFGTLIGFRTFAGGSQTVTTPPATFAPSAAEFDEIRFGSTFGAVTGTAPATSPWDDWLAANFTAEERALPAISGATADPDGDGSANLLEYAFDSNPRSGVAGPKPLVHTDASTVSVDYPASRTDVTYLVETSTTLVGWTSAGVTTTATVGKPGWRTATVSRGSEPRVFLRVRVTK